MLSFQSYSSSLGYFWAVKSQWIVEGGCHSIKLTKDLLWTRYPKRHQGQGPDFPMGQ